jgi:hypothetical protein
MVMFLPIVIFLWMIGWSLFWIGSENEQLRTKAIADNDGLSLIGIRYEEEYSEYS